MRGFLFEQFEIACIRNRQSCNSTSREPDDPDTFGIDERLARQPGQRAICVCDARSRFPRTGIGDVPRREAVDNQHHITPRRETLCPKMIGIGPHGRRQAAAAVQMHQRRKRSGSFRLGQVAINNLSRPRQDGFAAFEREAALQWSDLIARAFELHAFGRLCGAVDTAKPDEGAQRERVRF